jgi:cytosine/adenosine deaminase-related metal-dependent hydrolase
MADFRVQVLRSRVVYPVWRPPIEDGAVVVSGSRIVAVGDWRTLRVEHSGTVCDLGDTILMPGLINAHCHLDYTHMAGLFPPRKSFCDWIKLITTEKAQWTYSDFAESWLDGAKMLLRSGTTTVVDIEAVPELLPEVWEATPLRVWSLLEMTGVRSRRNPDHILNEALRKVSSLRHDRCVAGLSPHAPYSTTPRLLRRSAAAARKRTLLVATHVAESATEVEMFQQGRGEMHEWLQRNERDMSDCNGVSPVQHLARQHLLGSHLLAIHLNHLAPGDARLLARKNVSVVHCPRSHDYFKHQMFPYRALANAGVNICLGTDSLATVRTTRRTQPELNLFREMQCFADRHLNVPDHKIVRLATLNGARALGLAGQIGELNQGALADLTAIPFTRRRSEIHDTIIYFAGEVSASMIAGAWAIAPK